MVARTPSVLKVPAISLAQIPRNTNVAFFLRGTDDYDGARGNVKIEDAQGNQADARVISSDVGRFFSMCSRYMNLNVYNSANNAPPPGFTGVMLAAPLPNNGGMIQTGDTALFDALDDGGARTRHPLEPYTVVIAVVAPDATQAPGA